MIEDKFLSGNFAQENKNPVYNREISENRIFVQPSDALTEYKKRLNRYLKETSLVNGRIKQVSNLRLAIFVVVCACAVWFYRSHHSMLFAADLICGTVAFTIAVVWHNDLYRKRDILARYVLINEMGIKRIEGTWDDFKDDGGEFIDHDHPYSWDLDIFGKHSLYQWICASHTYSGRKKLAVKLSRESKKPEEIVGMQSGVKELADLLDWRQRFELNGLTSDTSNNPESFLSWCEDRKYFFKNRIAPAVFRIIPYASVLIGTAGYFISGTFYFFAAVYAVQLVILGLFQSKTREAIRIFEKNGSLLLAYSKLVESIEKQTFSSSRLISVKDRLLTGEKKNASTVLKLISKVITAAEIRFGMLYGIVNWIWLWDLQCVIRADSLRRKYGMEFRKWVGTIGEFEALSSLSTIRFEHPDWSFPIINNFESGIAARRLGHPLLHESIRVDNDFSMKGDGTAAIVTGSNMSGKSTFLRSVGVNLVLAYTGAPVCASEFVFSPVKIYSSMRINDDLSSKTSTFYAELLRIKKIVEAVKKGESVCFLLDELFRGTNSQDRHDGAVEVLRALSKQKTMGIISTHDLELCSLAETDPDKYVNYHFEEHFTDNKIAFDYLLKTGRSTTRNAMFLIRMVGIE